ncbi:MAG TPA: PHP domain-containing protein, partial [Afipia sp.]
MKITDYAEIGITTNFSFLRGGSQPQEYVREASALRLSAIGIADHNTLAGVVRAYKELRNSEVQHKPRLLIGARLVFADGTPDILIYPRDRAAYGRLCQLLTRGKLAAGKGGCHLKLDDLLDFAEGQLLVLSLPHRIEVVAALKVLDRLKRGNAAGVWLAASLLYRGDDTRRLSRLYRVAATARVPLLATNEVLYHHPARRPLQDVLACIREKTTIHAIGKKLQANAERHLKPGYEMARLFRELPEAVAETMLFADRITFTLDQLHYQYPDEPVPPGKTAQQHLRDLTEAGIRHYFPDGPGGKLQATIDKELRLIEKLEYAHYFLTVHDVVHHARSQNILCQGRG